MVYRHNPPSYPHFLPALSLSLGTGKKNVHLWSTCEQNAQNQVAWLLLRMVYNILYSSGALKLSGN